LQTNLKRLLAYSTIAQAGYMMMGLATFTRHGLSAVLFYLAAYLFMNLGAFAVVAFLRNQTGSEELSSHRGLMSRAPVLAVTLGIGRPAPLRVPWGSAVYSSLLAAAVLVLGISPNWYPMAEFSQQGVSQFKVAEQRSPSLVPPRTRPRPGG